MDNNSFIDNDAADSVLCCTVIHAYCRRGSISDVN